MWLRLNGAAVAYCYTPARAPAIGSRLARILPFLLPHWGARSSIRPPFGQHFPPAPTPTPLGTIQDLWPPISTKPSGSVSQLTDRTADQLNYRVNFGLRRGHRDKNRLTILIAFWLLATFPPKIRRVTAAKPRLFRVA